MKTKVTALVILLFLCVTAGYAEKIQGNGNIISKEIQISDYTELRIGVSINYSGNASLFKKENYKSPVFNYTQKTGNSTLQITIDENLLPLLDIRVSNGCLHVRASQDNLQLNPTKLVINSCSQKLDKAKVSGSIDFVFQNSFNGDNLKMEVSGAADVYMNKPARITNICEIKISGAGDMKASDLICRDIQVSISGAGDLDLKGKAKTGAYKVSGSGDLDAYDFIVEELECRVSGSGDIHAHATEKLYARASGAGDIKYKGDPRNDTRSSGGGEIKRVK